MPKRTSPAKSKPVRVVIVTLDSHLASAAERGAEQLRKELPGLELSLHAAAEWGSDTDSLARCHRAVAEADLVIATMLFMEDHIKAVLPALQARRDDCAAMICCMSAGEVMRLTRMGKFTMSGEAKGPMKLLKKLRGSKSGKPGSGASGAKQMAMLRRIPRILRYIPGTAQDLRAYFLTLQYWLAGSEENLAKMVKFLVGRYCDDSTLGAVADKDVEPVEYPDVGVYHPRLATKISDSAARLPKAMRSHGTVGLLVMRSYVLAGNTKHYDGVIAALEARGLRVIPAFSSGLDARPAVEAFFLDSKGRVSVDAVLSLTGFSLVGGPAYNDAAAAEEMLAKLDVPYVAAHPVEFQSMETWEQSVGGLTPVEATMMVAIPEIDGAIGSMVYGGRSGDGRDMESHSERAEVLAARVAKLVALRRAKRSERRLAIVLFNFPPNSGAVGSAAYLAVFESLFNTLHELARSGYSVGDLPESVDALRSQILKGNANRYGTEANVAATLDTDSYVATQPWLEEIEQAWGPAPGRHLTDGKRLFVLGQQFGNVLVAVQPGFGYEGDPMRLLFEQGMAPTHAFAGFYHYLRKVFDADACLHFGTHGALEFMPGKQTGLSSACWPDRLIGDLPNFYLYAANNPSEGTIAKRRSAATLVSYLTPAVERADLYRGLADLKSSLEKWRQVPRDAVAEGEESGFLAELIQAQAAALDLAAPEPSWGRDALTKIDRLWETVLEYEYTLIPVGLHVVGETPSKNAREELLLTLADARREMAPVPSTETIQQLLAGAAPEKLAKQNAASVPEEDRDAWRAHLDELARAAEQLGEESELPALVHALDGGFIRPAPGGDLIRTLDVLPTGRNVHGFDPYRMPSAFAVADGQRQADKLVAAYQEQHGRLPETVALVLWGTDNIKSEGAAVAQALALLGAAPRYDSYGRLCGARLLPLESLDRPRIDVMATLSGIFRDLLPLQTRMLAEAALLAAGADEPLEQNFVRRHVLAYQEANDCDLETAALRVFSNADGAYGANVNQLVDSGAWDDESELADVYSKRKCFAYGVSGQAMRHPELLANTLKNVDLAYQNLDSVELGVTTIDHYFDTLGGIGKAVEQAQGEAIPVYVSDQSVGEGKIRTLSEQVALETRTRTLNPKWYEGMLEHGFEGVRQIEAQITNTLGWSATTGQVAPWVYERLTDTFVLDEAMRKRLAELNPAASVRVANRLLEAHERNYWTPDDDVLDELRRAGEDLEDQWEGVAA